MTDSSTNNAVFYAGLPTMIKKCTGYSYCLIRMVVKLIQTQYSHNCFQNNTKDLTYHKYDKRNLN